VTALTTTMLVASGITLWRAGRRFVEDPASSRPLVAWAMGLGTVFVGVQGVEWVRLVSEGLTLSSSTFGSFFYLIVGAHALHAIPALVVLGWTYVALRRGTLSSDTFAAVRLFWYFVVLLWPVLYVLVYL
jgi:heme/copper-type cytochrome/quinol oxidase subunit 3